MVSVVTARRQRALMALLHLSFTFAFLLLSGSQIAGCWYTSSERASGWWGRWDKGHFPTYIKADWRKSAEVFFTAGWKVFPRSWLVSSGSSNSLLIITAAATRRKTARSWNSFENRWLPFVRVCVYFQENLTVLNLAQNTVLTLRWWLQPSVGNESERKTNTLVLFHVHLCASAAATLNCKCTLEGLRMELVFHAQSGEKVVETTQIKWTCSPETNVEEQRQKDL